MTADVLGILCILVLGAVLVVLLQIKRMMREHTAAINFTNERIGQHALAVGRFTDVLLKVNLENETRTGLHLALMDLTKRMLHLKLQGGP